MDIRRLTGDFDKTEDDIKALQSVGQIIGEVLKQLDDERCKLVPAEIGHLLMLKSSSRLLPALVMSFPSAPTYL